MATPPFKDDTFLARWLSGELSSAEEQELRARPDFADYERMLGNLSRMAPPVFDATEGFQKLKSERAKRRATDAPELALHPRPRLIRKLLPWSAAAAVALLLAAGFLLMQDSGDFFEAANGEQDVMAELTDGSSARLNAGSALTFAVTEEERTVTLKGEAYFEVEKSTVPFVVKTPLGEVRVLGTSFNVYSRNGEMTVGCTTGKVSVRFAGEGKDYRITKGQSVRRIGTEAGERADTTGVDQLDWLSGKSVFVKRPLAEILDELERQYMLMIDRPTSLNQEKTYTVTFENDDLDLALGSALGPIEDFDFELKERTVLLIPTQ